MVIHKRVLYSLYNQDNGEEHIMDLQMLHTLERVAEQVMVMRVMTVAAEVLLLF